MRSLVTSNKKWHRMEWLFTVRLSIHDQGEQDENRHPSRLQHREKTKDPDKQFSGQFSRYVRGRRSSYEWNFLPFFSFCEIYSCCHFGSHDKWPRRNASWCKQVRSIIHITLILVNSHPEGPFIFSISLVLVMAKVKVIYL